MGEERGNRDWKEVVVNKKMEEEYRYMAVKTKKYLLIPLLILLRNPHHDCDIRVRTSHYRRLIDRVARRPVKVPKVSYFKRLPCCPDKSFWDA